MVSKCVSIKFCGGCNPRIDRGRIAQAVRQSLAELGYEVTYNRLDDIDFVIYISGCTVGCAQKNNEPQTPFVAVAGTTIDLTPAEEEELANKILSKVRDCFE